MTDENLMSIEDFQRAASAVNAFTTNLLGSALDALDSNFDPAQGTVQASYLDSVSINW